MCCWEIREIDPYLDTLDAISDLSLGVIQVVLESLKARWHGEPVVPLSCPGAIPPQP